MVHPPPRSPLFPYTTLFRSFGGSSTIRPTADCGYRAATAASMDPVAEGNIGAGAGATVGKLLGGKDRKSTRLNSSHLGISYAVFCLKKKTSTDTAWSQRGGY